LSLKDKGSHDFIKKWYGIVIHMKWGSIKKRFSHERACQFTLDDDADVRDRLALYRPIAEASQTVFLTNNSEGKMANAKACALAAQKNVNIKVIRVAIQNDINPTKRVERSDSGKPRKWVDQAKAVEDFVQDRWNSGDPATRQEVYDMLRTRDDCDVGSAYYEGFLTPNKQAGLAGFVTRCLNRINYSERKNSIGQKVPEDWREQAIANAEEVRKVFKEADVDIVVNADQTFLRFYPEQEYVLAPKGCKRVGGKVKTDEKAGCTLMVSAELNSSRLLPPFIVMNGTKKINAKNLQQTLWWRYRDWSSRPGHNATITFQQKHWFDEDITIEYLEFLLQCYTREVIGLVWDACTAHNAPKVRAFIEQHKDRIIAVGIRGGLTSVIQVCDLVANKDLKQLIKTQYYLWRTDFIKGERERLIAEGKDPLNTRIKIKVPLEDTVKMVEAAFKEFNVKQREKETIKNTFRKVNMDPWRDSEKDFLAHLDSLAEDSMYKTLYESNTAEELA
jgi:hypothetical protein